MNSYGTVRQLAIQLVPGEPAKGAAKPAIIPRTSAHFAALKGAELEYQYTDEQGKDHYRKRQYGVAKYDLLALDAIPRLVKSGFNLVDRGKRVANTESLITDRVQAPKDIKSVTYQSFGDWRYTPSATRQAEIRQANSTNHILNPTGGNVCPRCGYDKYCTCPLPVWAGGAPKKVKAPEPKPVQPVVNGGIWLRGTKLYAILP